MAARNRARAKRRIEQRTRRIALALAAVAEVAAERPKLLRARHRSRLEELAARNVITIGQKQAVNAWCSIAESPASSSLNWSPGTRRGRRKAQAGSSTMHRPRCQRSHCAADRAGGVDAHQRGRRRERGVRARPLAQDRRCGICAGGFFGRRAGAPAGEAPTGMEKGRTEARPKLPQRVSLAVTGASVPRNDCRVHPGCACSAASGS